MASRAASTAAVLTPYLIIGTLLGTIFLWRRAMRLPPGP